MDTQLFSGWQPLDMQKKPTELIRVRLTKPFHCPKFTFVSCLKTLSYPLMVWGMDSVSLQIKASYLVDSPLPPISSHFFSGTPFFVLVDVFSTHQNPNFGRVPGSTTTFQDVPGTMDDLGQAHVCQLHTPLIGQQQVLWLQVSEKKTILTARGQPWKTVDGGWVGWP